MNIDILISAANWLYENSPAQRITEAHSSILVYGDGELADKLFELLFTTAYWPGRSIELVRVCTRASDKETDFVLPNEDWLKYYARTPMNVMDQRPLAIRFIDSDSEEWRKMDKSIFIYAIVPKDSIMPEDDKLEQKGCKVFSLESIPVVDKQGEPWSPQGEKTVPVLRVARKVHTAYTMGWNDRYREEDIDRDLYGADDYMLRSSVRLAVSIPWKLAIANVKNGDQMLVTLRSKRSQIQGRSIKDYIAWQEHRSWQAFMLLDGWKMPTDEQMEQYMFQNGHDHRDKTSKLHPCLCDLERDDWFDEKYELKDCPPSEWSRLYNNRLREFTLLDQISLKIHHKCKEIVIGEDYRQQMLVLFDEVEKTLVECHPRNMGIQFDRLRLVERMFSRLLNNEKNSYNPFEQACNAFIEGIRNGSEEEEADKRIRSAFWAMQRAAGIAVERNKYCDYKSIDANIINWIPWIVDDATADTVWKLYANGTYFENITSTIILRPRRLVFVCEKGKLPAKMIDAYKRVLQRHGLTSLIIESVSAEDFVEGKLDIEGSVPVRNWIDFVGADLELSSKIVIPEGAKSIDIVGGELRDMSKRVPLPYCQKIRFTIDEVILIKGHSIISLSDDNEMLGMEEDYEALWKLCTDLKKGGTPNPWKDLIKVLKEADTAIRFPI